MARRNFNDGQEVVFEDLNKVGATVERELYDRVIYEMLQRAGNAFFSDSMIVSYVSPTSVSANAGAGFQTDGTQVDPEPTRRLLYRSGSTTLNLSAPDLTNNRIDIVCVKAARVDGSTESRKYKAPVTSVISNQNLVVSKEWQAEFLVVDGTPSGAPAIPSTPAGYIKIANLLVTAVTGMSGAGAVTDTRTLLPVAGSATVNSLAFVKLTPSAALTIQQALSEADGLLRDGTSRQNDFLDRVTDPAAPAASNIRIYNKGGLLFVRESGGTVTPVGSGGGGGGGGARWIGDSLAEEEFDQEVKKFAQGLSQKETLYLKVPQGYLTGRQIKMFLGLYSPSATLQWKMQTVTSLARKNQDAVNSSTNQHTQNSGDITNDNANEFREITTNLTDASGLINGFAVNPGDMLRVELTRIAPAGSEDTNELRMVPSTTEVKFG